MGSASQIVSRNLTRVRSPNGDRNITWRMQIAALWILRSMDRCGPWRYEKAGGSGER
jgi:hypothetical protein